MNMTLRLPTDKAQRLEVLEEAGQEVLDMLRLLEAAGCVRVRLSLEAWVTDPTPANGGLTS